MSNLNPHANSFVPRAGAAPFVPGQPQHNTSPQHTPQASPAMENGDAADEAKPQTSAPQPPPAQPPAPAAAPAEPEAAAESWEAAGGSEAPSETATPADTEVEEEEEEEEESGSELGGKKAKEAKPAVRASTKEPVNVVFIGHVDAGKSTIGGQIMKVTGMVDERTLQKYEREAKEKNRESWALSWCMDTNLEERDKGKTVELGRAYFETEKKHFTILDAPGHKSFVPNMIGGASQADLAVLVISARKGEFETGFDRGGQTREHAMLVKTAGVSHLVVLVNKMDDHTVKWSEERWKEIQAGLSPYLRKVGFKPKDVKFIPCSGLTGAFIKEAPAAGTCPWYDGPCFIPFIDDLPIIERNSAGPVRVILADKYTDMGTIVLGKVESGTVRKGMNLTLMPNKATVQVVQLWSDEVETEEVVSGENVKFKLKGIEENEILPGFCLCSPDALCKVGRIFDAQVHILEPPAASIMCPGYTAVLHIHNAVEEAVVKNLICLVQKGEKVRPPGGLKFVKQDQAAIVRFETSETFCLERFDDFPQMARFTLRDEGRTIAIGKVLKLVE